MDNCIFIPNLCTLLITYLLFYISRSYEIKKGLETLSRLTKNFKCTSSQSYVSKDYYNSQEGPEGKNNG